MFPEFCYANIVITSYVLVVFLTLAYWRVFEIGSLWKIRQNVIFSTFGLGYSSMFPRLNMLKNIFSLLRCNTAPAYLFKIKFNEIKQLRNCFTHCLCVFLILLNTGSYKSASLHLFFWKTSFLVFLCFLWFPSVFCFEYDLMISLCDFTLWFRSPFIKNTCKNKNFQSAKGNLKDVLKTHYADAQDIWTRCLLDA